MKLICNLKKKKKKQLGERKGKDTKGEKRKFFFEPFPHSKIYPFPLFCPKGRSSGLAAVLGVAFSLK